MAISIETHVFFRSHGANPSNRVRGQWMFERQASHGQEARMFTSPCMTFREASAWVRKQVRNEGFQDATVHVMP